MRSFVFNCLFWSLSAVFALLCYILAWLPWRTALIGGMVAYCRTIRATLRWIAGIKVEYRGEIPRNQPVIIAAKHQSYADGPMMMAAIGDINFVIGNAIEKFPLINRIVRESGATMVNTQGNTKAPGALEESIRRSQNEGRPVLIYPEGGLSPVGETWRYRKGVYKLYETLDRPVIPAATNMGLRWQQEAWHKSPGVAVIEFLDPIPPGLPRENFMQSLETAIETRCRALENEGRPALETAS
jgi:1-acyl-sn-glycerol-3-phosphate acyltransferase